jgi:hypothetical protein
MFNSSRIKETCLIPFYELARLFYEYSIYMYPELKDDICNRIWIGRYYLKRNIIRCLSEKYIFIKKNYDEMILSYRMELVKCDVLSICDLEDEEFRRELYNRADFIVDRMNDLSVDEIRFHDFERVRFVIYRKFL